MIELFRDEEGEALSPWIQVEGTLADDPGPPTEYPEGSLYSLMVMVDSPLVKGTRKMMRYIVWAIEAGPKKDHWIPKLIKGDRVVAVGELRLGEHSQGRIEKDPAGWIWAKRLFAEDAVKQRQKK